MEYELLAATPLRPRRQINGHRRKRLEPLLAPRPTVPGLKPSPRLGMPEPAMYGHVAAVAGRDHAPRVGVVLTVKADVDAAVAN